MSMVNYSLFASRTTGGFDPSTGIAVHLRTEDPKKLGFADIGDTENSLIREYRDSGKDLCGAALAAWIKDSNSYKTFQSRLITGNTVKVTAHNYASTLDDERRETAYRWAKR